MQKNAIGAYRTSGGTCWAAYDKEGRWWPVSAAEATEIEAERKARNVEARRPETPNT